MDFLKRKCNKYRKGILKGINVKFYHKVHEISNDETQQKYLKQSNVLFCYTNTNIDNRANVLHLENYMNAKKTTCRLD